MAGPEVLLIGNGGREHAIAEQLAPVAETLYYTNENPGIAMLDGAVSIGSADPAAFALEVRPDLTIIGPEAPLIAGVANKLRVAELPVFGPSERAAQLEGSKLHARRFMARWGIPTPQWDWASTASQYRVVANQYPEASGFVLKADKPAGGKGVVLPEDREEADVTAWGMLHENLFDGAGKDFFLVEERCHGPEISMFVLTDGTNFSVLPFTQDHKRRNDGDDGKNTGGMGAYTIPDGTLLTNRQVVKLHEIAHKSVEGMAAEGIPYRGVLYVGAMLAEEYDDDPIVIEYNVRFGDPEAQVLLSLLGEDAYDILASTDTRLRQDLLTPAKLTGQLALTVCLAARSYPESGDKGTPIFGLNHTDNYDGVSIYHGGTRRDDSGNVVTNGGRVLYVTGRGETPDQASDRAYRVIDPQGVNGGVFFRGMHYRTDIGHQVRTNYTPCR